MTEPAQVLTAAAPEDAAAERLPLKVAELIAAMKAREGDLFFGYARSHATHVTQTDAVIVATLAEAQFWRAQVEALVFQPSTEALHKHLTAAYELVAHLLDVTQAEARRKKLRDALREIKQAMQEVPL